MQIVESIFWLTILCITYVYVGFPALLYLRSCLRKTAVRRGSATPPITVIIVAHNEAASIRRKLDNLLELDYPRERFSVVVASDGSDDGTNNIVAEYKAQGIRLLTLPRQGKIPALNAAVSQAEGELLVFSDANSIYARNALRELVQPFADPSVGGVAGNQCYVSSPGGHHASLGERAYWNFDQSLKRWQSNAGSVTSATGAIYAVRRELFDPVPSGVGDDAVISYRVIARGYRMLYEPNAIAYETLAPSPEAEFWRKVRVCTRGLRGLLAVPQLLNPVRHGFYSAQLASHKLLRWLMAWPLIVLFLTSIWLQSAGAVYHTAAMAQITFYGLALVVFVFFRKGRATTKLFKLLTLPFYFCLANAACLVAQVWLIQGRRIDTWEVRRTGIQESETAMGPSIVTASPK